MAELLEPVVSPRLGQALNLFGGLGALGLTLLSATVTTTSGVVPMIILAPLVALGFFLRFGGITIALARDDEVMPWGARVGSWIAFGAGVLLLGLAGSLISVGVFAGLVVLDAAAGLAKRPKRASAPRKPLPWRRVGVTALALAYVGGLVAFHLFVARYLPYGTLVTWTLMSLAFAFVIRQSLVGAKAGEAWLRAPRDHHVHEHREQVVADPQRERAEAIVTQFRGRGDAGPFLALVREAAASADLHADEVARLEERILASFARAGTNRDEDLRQALDEVESFLSLRSRPLEVRT